MKRCPQCEFIYEDDQSLCDMDGVLLVFDSRTLPNPHALVTVPQKTQGRRNRAVPAFATLILAGVLGLVYYVSTQPNASQPMETATPPAAASVVNPVPEVQPTPEPQPSEQPAEEPKPETIQPAAAVPTKKATTKAASSTAPRTSSEPKKEDSKVESVLKKTGRFLKKPFKKF